MEFLYCTGCRVGEVNKLNIEDINWENHSAIVNGKGSKQREVYFTAECKVWLKRYLESRKDSCKALFVTECHPIRRMTIPTIRYSLKVLATRGKVVANVYPHRFRHTYACQLLDNGAPLEFIKGVLGYEKASTTQIYAQLRGGHMMVDKLLQTAEGNGITRSIVYSASKQWQKSLVFMKSMALKCGLFKCTVKVR